jgi:undecaprenyl-diphosphatase
MDPVLAFLVGLLQGVTEWLPISSSGQVLIVLDNSGVDSNDALALAFFLHFGTLFAVLVRLRGDVIEVVGNLPKWRTDPMVRFLLIATLVSLPVGFILVQTLEEAVEGSVGGVLLTVLVGAMLIITGFVLRAAKNKLGERKVEDMTGGDAAVMGFVQGLAALPGISRSGMTVSALLMDKVDGDEALRLSFLMSIPVTIAVLLYEVVTWDLASIGVVPIVVGVVASFVFGYLTIDGLMAVSRRMDWSVFCLAFGAIAVIAGIILLFV